MRHRHHHTRRNTRRRPVLAGLLATIVGTVALAGQPAHAAEKQSSNLLPIEDMYAAVGPSAVNRDTVTDATGAQCEVFYPANLGEGGTTHPILTYANGSGGTPDGSAPQVGHYASWGYVVTVSHSGQTGNGNEVWACTQKAISDNTNQASSFFGKLDPEKVGAFGHSQGATGAIRATILSDGVIKSTLPVALVDPIWHGGEQGLPDFGAVTTPILFLAGSADFLTQPTWQQNYYNRINGAAARAMRKNADHGGIIAASNAYGVAWFKYTLENDAKARGAFVGNPPEINTNPNWENQAQKALP